MTPESMSLLYSSLAVVALAGSLMVAPLGVPGLACAGSWLRRHSLLVAWAVAFVATTGSLYFSEVADYVPCELCWYQRVAMYPLAVVLLIAVVRRDREIRRYVAPLVAIGALVSVYHYVIQRFPSLISSSCDIENPCSLTWVWQFHFVSIPFMAMSGFVFILSLMLFGEEGS